MAACRVEPVASHDVVDGYHDDAFDRLCVDLFGGLRARLSEAHHIVLKELQNERNHYALETARLGKECARLAAMVTEPSQALEYAGSSLIHSSLDGDSWAAGTTAPGKLFSNRPESTGKPPCAGMVDAPTCDQEDGAMGAKGPPIGLPAAAAAAKAAATESKEVQPETIGSISASVSLDKANAPRCCYTGPQKFKSESRIPQAPMIDMDEYESCRIDPNNTLRQANRRASNVKSPQRPSGSRKRLSSMLRSQIDFPEKCKNLSIVESQDLTFKNRALAASVLNMDEAYLEELDLLADSNKNGRLSKCRWYARAIVQKQWFEVFFAMAILTNSCFLGVEVHHSVSYPDRGQPLVFYLVGHIYTILFCIELSIRFSAFQPRTFFCGPNFGWNWLDIVIVAASLVELATDTLNILRDTQGRGVQNFSNARIVRVMRIAKMARLLRIARLLKFVRALRTLVYQIAGTMKSVFWAMVLMLLINYVFAMIFVQAVSDFVADEDDGHVSSRLLNYWGTLPRTMYTLYKAITGGVDWENVVNPLSDVSWMAVAVFLIFLSFSLFAVMNTVTGVFCQRAIEAADHDYDSLIRKEIIEKRLYMKKTKELFKEIDKNESNELSYHEFESHMQDERVLAYFSVLGLDHRDAWDLFKLLDKDRSAQVDIDEFVTGFMRLRGGAKSIDIAKLAYENKQMRVRLASFMTLVEQTLHRLLETSSSLQ